MIRRQRHGRWAATLALALSIAPPAALADGAAHLSVFASDDADDTSTLETGLTLDYRFEDVERYRGIKLERLDIRPLGGERWRDHRAYYRFADYNDHWLWNGQVGTDGDTVVGNANFVRGGRVRQEYFVERDVLETPRGVEGLHHTFLGASFDLPLGEGERQQLTTLVGVQDFTGSNIRAHLRASYIATVVPEWGLSAQLRTRAFHNSTPGEYDYYSPRWFAEAVPVLQVRRFHKRWMYSAALGWGWQRNSGADVREARLVEAAVTSPRTGRDWYFRATASYSNTPTGAGQSYGYRQLMLELVRPF
ncbi:hypothetical protein [Novilysobacter spongiicola]|uniref:Uncharacterized protein n=1 Tax=Lysobacter spongiicola DSM 21749 TaxID=1122188 RepID=A0A1T4S455_9GAMM|nr:hypothetical protein [Lysobacter spongiicola]SKA23080.1 hypothetical protein SAMN02745674_02563 [Lysobacter spongiicola DSM 21749]